MTTLPKVHICVMQPARYVYSLGLLDPARYLRHQFRRFGAEVTIAKNRLHEDAVNFVLGAHLGFPADWTERHACVFVNLEQLGAGGAELEPPYLELLRRSAVIDYDAGNVAAYSANPADAADVPLISFLHAPYLVPRLAPRADRDEPIALEDRPIDLLFIGDINARRKRLIDRIEATGVGVSVFDEPLFGPERDSMIRQAKAVFNCHYYDTSRFEQVRVSHCLSLGTPVISERAPQTRPLAAFEDAVTWLRCGGDAVDKEAAIERFFTEHFATPAWFDAARTQLAGWPAHDPMEAYADALAFAAGFQRGHAARRDTARAWQPRQINLGSGKDYKPGWLNLDVIERADPDLLLDLSRPLTLPLAAPTRFGGEVLIEAGSIDRIHANNVLEHVVELTTLMTNALTLLRLGGEIEVEVPYERALTAWQDPTHVRALNENSWAYYTDWFWYLGWFEHRFEIASSTWLDLNVQPCKKEQAGFMRLSLRKVETTLRERTAARMVQHDFGGIDDDLIDAPDEAAVAGVADEAAPRSAPLTTPMVATC